MQASGALPHTLVNDYMFKALLQKNKMVLKHLICSMLHLRPEEVVSVNLTNPIVLGKSLTEDLDSKTFVLDVNTPPTFFPCSFLHPPCAGSPAKKTLSPGFTLAKKLRDSARYQKPSAIFNWNNLSLKHRSSDILKRDLPYQKRKEIYALRAY